MDELCPVFLNRGFLLCFMHSLLGCPRVLMVGSNGLGLVIETSVLMRDILRLKDEMCVYGSVMIRENEDIYDRITG